MEPYIVELICQPLSWPIKNTVVHGSACAIAATPDEAKALACNQAMSHGYAVLSVVGAVPASAVPPDEWDESVDTPLLRKAQQRESRCAILFVGHEQEHEGRYFSLGIPDDGKPN